MVRWSSDTLGGGNEDGEWWKAKSTVVRRNEIENGSLSLLLSGFGWLGYLCTSAKAESSREGNASPTFMGPGEDVRARTLTSEKGRDGERVRLGNGRGRSAAEQNEPL